MALDLVLTGDPAVWAFHRGGYDSSAPYSVCKVLADRSKILLWLQLAGPLMRLPGEEFCQVFRS